MPAQHDLPARPENMVWGYLDAATEPVLRVDSGDTVTLACVPAGGPPSLPADRSLVPAEYLAALERLPPGPGAHFVTGPVFVRGAAPGDTLQVDILSATPTMDWGLRFHHAPAQHAARRVHRVRDRPPAHRPRAGRVLAALGDGAAARPLLRRPRHRRPRPLLGSYDSRQGTAPEITIRFHPALTGSSNRSNLQTIPACI